jgi:leucyl/phenylalanyl-tRNA---protein transferase
MPVYMLSDEIRFPYVQHAEPEGLLAIGGDLSPERLLAAYSLGIFPWYSDGEPIMWWSPDPRLVLFPDRFRVSHSLRQKINRNIFEVRFDTVFSEIVEHCAKAFRQDQNGTWITREMKDAYQTLHELGYAHSVEVFYQGELAGGLYGVSLGNAFFGESMFHLFTDASKVAMYHLVAKVKSFGFLMIDSQVETDHLLSLGAELIPRTRYMELLDNALLAPTRQGSWGL